MGKRKMKETKTFNVIMPKELWAFLKKKALEEETSMAQLINRIVEKMKRKDEKKDLQNDDANV
jgi:hypothetical protein